MSTYISILEISTRIDPAADKMVLHIKAVTPTGIQKISAPYDPDDVMDTMTRLGYVDLLSTEPPNPQPTLELTIGDHCLLLDEVGQDTIWNEASIVQFKCQFPDQSN